VDIVVLSTASAEANALLPGLEAAAQPASGSSTTTHSTTTEGSHG
jgi:chemotaxis protein MotB